jgi:hypothetical protein
MRMQLKAALTEAKRRDSDLARMEEEMSALVADYDSFRAGVQVCAMRPTRISPSCT